ncbi:collagen alpha-1(XI) chain-like, partial [Notothenia coriiceps]|uniref:Collagen alpha-1(XI) chain-like n=1 Tax=Notothenia coriiceps TaxID=8208 RepID=A0A6I9NSS9_9TELE
VERKPKKHVAEEFEEFDYSDLYEDRSVSTATAGPNDTEYEIVEYEDYDNTTEYEQVNEYEYEDEYDDRYGHAEMEREISLNTRNIPEKGEKGEPSFLGAGTQITGPPGPPGPEGETGPFGVTGSVGPRGDAGELGPSGRPGLNGADGIPGPPGNIMLIPVTHTGARSSAQPEASQRRAD